MADDPEHPVVRPRTHYPSRDRMRAEAQLLDGWLHSLRAQPRPKLSLDESSALASQLVHHVGLGYGLAAGIGALTIMRHGPLWLTRWWVRRRNQTKAAAGLDKVVNSPFDRPIPRAADPWAEKNPLMHTAWWMLDLSLSIALGGVVAVAASDQTALAHDLADWPNRSGHSALADTYCAPAIAYLEQYRHSDLTLHPSTVGWKAAVEFSRNCQRRQRYQAQLRRQRGLDDAAAVVAIPPPGVPDKLPSDEPSSEDRWWDNQRGRW